MLLASMILSKRPDQTFRAVTYQVHSSGHFEAFQHQFSVCRILVLHQNSLYCFFMGVLRHIYLLTCKRMDSRIVHTGRKSRRGPGTSHRPLFLEQLREPYQRTVLWINNDFFETCKQNFFADTGSSQYAPQKQLPYVIRPEGTLLNQIDLA